MHPGGSGGCSHAVRPCHHSSNEKEFAVKPMNRHETALKFVIGILFGGMV
jgi:hypothetical protein